MRHFAIAAIAITPLLSAFAFAQETAHSQIEMWTRTNERCRKAPETHQSKSACAERQEATVRLMHMGYCYGLQHENSTTQTWHRCDENTLPMPEGVEAETNANASVPTKPVQSSGSQGGAFELRGIRLGASLDAIRAMRHPDGEPARLFCSGDPEVVNNSLSFPDLTAHVVDRTAPAGTRFCQYYKARGDRDGVIETGFRVATVGSFVTFDFVPGSGGQPLLYRITVRTNVSGWPQLWEGYRGKFGNPKQISNAPTTNRAGGTFDNVTAVWENDVSRITAIKRHQRVDNTYIFYEHKQLAAHVEKRLRSRMGTPADGL